MRRATVTTTAALAVAALAAAALAGCGQTGPLYLPDAGGEVVTRPAPTPAPTPAPASAPDASAPDAPKH